MPLSDRLRTLAFGGAARGFDQRRHGPLPVVPPPADTVYVHPADGALIRGWAAMGLDHIGPARRLIESEHVPAGYVVTSDVDLRQLLDTLLARYRAADRDRLLGER